MTTTCRRAAFASNKVAQIVALGMFNTLSMVINFKKFTSGWFSHSLVTYRAIGYGKEVVNFSFIWG